MKPTPPPIRATHCQTHSKGPRKADVYLRVGANLHRARVEQKNKRALTVTYFPRLALRHQDAARRCALAAMVERAGRYSIMGTTSR